MGPSGQGVIVVEGRAGGQHGPPASSAYTHKGQGVRGVGWAFLCLGAGGPVPSGGMAGAFPFFRPPSQPRIVTASTVFPRTRTWALMPTKAAAATMRLKARMVVGGWGVVGCVGGVGGWRGGGRRRRVLVRGTGKRTALLGWEPCVAAAGGGGQAPVPPQDRSRRPLGSSSWVLCCGVGGLDLCVGGSRAPCVPWVVAKR